MHSQGLMDEVHLLSILYSYDVELLCPIQKRVHELDESLVLCLLSNQSVLQLRW